MNAKSTSRIVASGIAALAIAGCASRPATVPVTAPATVSSVPAAAALAPALYMQLAASSALFAVRASEVAQERTSDSRLRQVAGAIAHDQRGIGSQLNFAGRRLNLLPSAALSDQQAADLERLRTAGNVDALYRNLLAPVLARAAQVHASFAAKGSSPTLRPVAQMAAPATRRNLQQIRSR